MSNKIKKNKGFTLIELLVVIAIIGLLSTLAVVALDSAREKSRDSKRVTDIRQIQTALELYFSDEEQYPVGNGFSLGEGASCEGATATCVCLDSDGFTDRINCDDGGTDVIYMGLVPANPKPDGAVYDYIGWNIASAGACDGGLTACDSYEITFTLEGEVNDLASGPHVATPAGML